MTLAKDPPAEERLDEALRCIGLIAVGSAALEIELARLACHATDGLEYHAALKLSNKKKVQAVRAGLQTRRNLNGSERRDAAGRQRAIAWAEKAQQLLQRRGDLMHSEWILARRISDRRAPTEWLSHHLSTGQRTPIDPVNLRQLADEIADHVRRHRRIWEFAVRISPAMPKAYWDRFFSAPEAAQSQTHPEARA